MIRIAILHNDILQKNRIVSAIQDDNELVVVCKTSDIESFFKALPCLKIDVVIVSSQFANTRDIPFGQEVKLYSDRTNVVVSADLDDASIAYSMLQCATSACWLDTDPIVYLLEAIYVVAEGGTYLSPSAPYFLFDTHLCHL